LIDRSELVFLVRSYSDEFFTPDVAQACKVATMPSEPVARSWRTMLRFSVRAMVILVLVIGAGLGWIVRSARIQRDAVAAIRRHGGSVLYDGEQGTRVYFDGRRFAPKWLVDKVRVYYFDNVVSVHLGQGGSAADLHDVGRLSQLMQLRLYGPFVTDAGLAELHGLTNLFLLDIGDTEFTCTDRTKRPGAARVTDAGLAYLDGLSILSFVNLSGTRVTDAGLVHLKRLTKLEVLCLDDTLITDAGLAQLKELIYLKYLHIHDTQITDDGLARLGGLTKLRHLDVGNTQITDAGLAHLKGLTELSELDLSGNRVTDAGTKKLKQALPSLSVSR
jgi:Leucine rich repeat